ASTSKRCLTGRPPQPLSNFRYDHDRRSHEVTMRTPLAAAVDLWRSRRIVLEWQQVGMSESRLSIPRENLESSGISLRMNPIRKEPSNSFARESLCTQRSRSKLSPKWPAANLSAKT